MLEARSVPHALSHEPIGEHRAVWNDRQYCYQGCAIAVTSCVAAGRVEPPVNRASAPSCFANSSSVAVGIFRTGVASVSQAIALLGKRLG